METPKRLTDTKLTKSYFYFFFVTIWTLLCKRYLATVSDISDIKIPNWKTRLNIPRRKKNQIVVWELEVAKQ